jgi:hypothetical protein
MGRPLDEMTFTVTRRPGAWDGSWVFSAFSTFSLLASRPQPVGPEAIDFLEEGARTMARYVIYAHDDQPDLYSTRDGFAADTIAYNGKTYEVTTDDDYHSMPLGYRAYILLEYGADEEVPTP